MEGKIKILANSVILYVRLIVVTLLKLWVTRLLLQNLGVDDFGLYNLLAGIIAMLSFLKVALANASQRFLSISLGEKSDTSEVFYTSYVLHACIGLLVLLIIDIGGCFLIYNVLNILPEKIDAAMFVIHALAFSMFVTMLNVPYDALLIAKENILTLSIFIVLETLTMLFGAYCIVYVDNGRLELFSMCVLVGNYLLFLGRTIICRMKYKETRFRFHKIHEFKTFLSITKFVGWNAISSLLVIVRNQGFAILFNIAGGVVINAAYGIANQVNALFSYCSEALMQPNRPVIMKSYGAGDKARALMLTSFTTKIIMLISTIIFVILFVNMKTILGLWLHNVPDYSIDFCRIIISATFFVQFSLASKAMVEATGNVKSLYMVVGYFHICSLILGGIVYYITRDFIYMLIPLIAEELASTIYRVYLLSKQCDILFWTFCKRNMFAPLICALIIMSFTYIINIAFNEKNYLIISIPISIIGTLLFYILFIFSTKEKKELAKVARSFI